MSLRWRPTFQIGLFGIYTHIFYMFLLFLIQGVSISDGIVPRAFYSSLPASAQGSHNFMHIILYLLYILCEVTSAAVYL